MDTQFYNRAGSLKAAGVAFSPHLYRYVEHGGTQTSAQALGVSEHCVVKTLIMEDHLAHPLIVLMHGDHEVSTRALARQIGVRSVTPCRADVAERHSGYRVGGTSPFGTRHSMKVYMQSTLLELEKVYINGGARGFLVGLSPHEIVRLLSPQLVDVERD